MTARSLAGDARVVRVSPADVPAARVYDVDWSALMARAQDGDAAAYRRLLDEIAPYLRALAYRHGADPGDLEDAVQDILVTLHAIRNTYDRTRPFGPWLAAVARHRLVDRRRRHARRKRREIPIEAEHEALPSEDANLEARISDRRELAAALDRLPAGERQALRMLKLDELSLKEAAAGSGISAGALKVATHRAMKRLRRILSSGRARR